MDRGFRATSVTQKSLILNHARGPYPVFWNVAKS
jgi:hypothetical protein